MCFFFFKVVIQSEFQFERPERYLNRLDQVLPAKNLGFIPNTALLDELTPSQPFETSV